jgi:membrane-bound metal-dependent hydrolase YbcI (DUF457 family)
MFIGHFAVGIGAKALQPKLSLGTLFIAVQFLDLLWPSLLMLNLEHVTISPGITAVAPLDFDSYPISHSLFMTIVWSLLFGLTYFFYSSDKKSAIILGLCVMSHWLLDLLVHRPDLPISPISDLKVGFGLWYSLYATIIIETAFFLIGICMYYKVNRENNTIVSWGFYALIGLLYIIYLINTLGPVPNSVKDISIGAQFQWLFVIWAYWIDRKKRNVAIA